MRTVVRVYICLCFSKLLSDILKFLLLYILTDGVSHLGGDSVVEIIFVYIVLF